ncbi:DNA photolyase, FAD-binding [Gloeomargarita lithophora Alchichica-D10]|uniref:DNA photolyase, FAD-binding n=1 Tax=Gloeomargarita lithophora Alchichica-D10 TaxID=1188229 RepID=A0A1J0ABL1_9CYAN|nr:FAD-binding domain-containing protein [Gloeomargarita lithophora]APB33320.1 DNA photolyase, FAD-binding [Gloeomargarita lithophora Alchichica-D10]
MRREFASREDLIAYVTQVFPGAGGAVSATPGGRTIALQKLAQLQPQTYGDSRNYLAGAVTRLSPYLRHGVLTLAEVRDALQSQGYSWAVVEPLVRQLAWRDYWQKLYEQWGDSIWQDREPYKTGFTARDYAEELPADIVSNTTNLLCIDNFSQELQATGYLHNHIRLWLAAYIIHWRKIQWQAGAGWFLMHLLDGDPASNNLSWQWVASTFSVKPYYWDFERNWLLNGLRPRHSNCFTSISIFS